MKARNAVQTQTSRQTNVRQSHCQQRPLFHLTRMHASYAQAPSSRSEMRLPWRPVSYKEHLCDFDMLGAKIAYNSSSLSK